MSEGESQSQSSTSQDSDEYTHKNTDNRFAIKPRDTTSLRYVKHGYIQGWRMTASDWKDSNHLTEMTGKRTDTAEWQYTAIKN